jgi:dihydrofolate reductase
MSKPSLELIAAVARNGVIGRGGQLPWHLPDDLKFFKQTTMGHPCLMGRRTYESVGKPLPGRRTIVVSTSAAIPGVEVVRSLDDARQLVADVSGPVFVVGGSVLYEAALAVADALVLTEIDQDFDGDTYFPKFDRSQWRLVSEKPHAKDERHAVSFRFCRYERSASA